jgi:hypothetical protein
MKMIYIASAYTQGDTCTNLRRQIDAFDEILSAGYLPFAPTLSHFVDIVHHRSYEDWMTYCIEMVKKCDAVVRVASESPGADREVNIALAHDIPVAFVDKTEDIAYALSMLF